MKPTFYKDIEPEAKNLMLLASEIDFDLVAFNNYIKSLVMTRERANLIIARSILNNVIHTINDFHDENSEN